MRTTISLNILRCLAVLNLGTLACAQAADRTWINADGGAFVGSSANWQSGAIAGSSDVVLFGAASGPAYTVTLQADYAFQGLRNLSGNSVTVDLNSHTLTLSTSNALFTSGTLDFRNGVLSSSGSLFFGRTGTAASTLSGVNATLVALSVGVTTGSGVDSSGTVLTVEEGSTVTATGSVAVGGISTGSVSNNSKLLVTGAGSQFTGVDFRVGTANSSGNVLEVANGGTLNGAQLLVGSYHSGGGVYSTGNTSVLIHGQDLLPDQNSKVTLTGNIIIGAANIETTVNNDLTVKDSGEMLTAGSLLINGTATNTNNRLRVQSNGKVTLNNTSNTVNFGYIEINGGTLEGKGLTLANQGRLNFIDGNISIDGNLTTANVTGGRFGFDLSSGPLTIDISGTLTIGSGTNLNFIDILGVGHAGSYTLFTTGTAMNANVATRLALGNTVDGFEGTLVFNSNSIVLNVTAIPEPGTFFLVAAGLFVTVMRFRSASRVKI